MSCLYNRPDSPLIWWTANYKGKRLRKSTGVKNKKVANKIKDHWDLLLVMDDISFCVQNNNQSFGLREYIIRYLNYLSSIHSDKMFLTVKGILNRFGSFCDENKIKHIVDIRPIDINDYILSLKLAPKTKKNHFGEIKRMFSRAIVEEVISKDPFEHLKYPSIKKSDTKDRHRLLTPLDLRYIFEGAGKWKLFYEFLYHTGLRAGDVALLKHSNIDKKKKVIISLVRKSRRIHEFPIADILISSLDSSVNSNTPIFPLLFSENERRLNDNFAKPRKHMQMLLKAHGRPKATLHSFRHTFNQALTDLGLKIEDRQVLLAHASSEVTKLYTHPNFEKAKEFVNMIPIVKSGLSSVSPV